MILLFIFGLGVGSFLNVVALRYQPSQRFFTRDILLGRSHCPNCQKTLRWYELIPLLSFIIQLGRCRHCHHLLTWQYPIVELLSGLTFVLAPLYARPASVWILAILTLILIAIIDYRFSIIPDQLNAFLALLALAIVSITNYKLLITVHALGTVFGAGIFGLIILLTKGRGMGIGDLKLAAVLGLLFGWPKIILISGLAFIIGGLWAAALLLTKKKSLKDAIPFGPFFVSAAILIIFVGDAIMGVITN